jgi:AIPR protein
VQANAFKSALFNLNIRNYIGDNLTNKTIRKTAIDRPDDFSYFNNGISALATRVELDPEDRTGRTLRCENFSVVNGAQTIRSLNKAHIEKPVEVKNVQVLLRLTEVEAKKTQSQQEFLDNVTKYNNTQNSIRVSDFRSNDKVQYDIMKRFEALPAVEGKKFLYKNKRSGERDAGRIVVGMKEFVKTLYAFIFGPDDVFGGIGYLFDATKEGGYVKLFGDGKELLPSLSKETFEYYAGIWFACSHAKESWKEQTARTKDPALERRWMFYFALGEALRVVYGGQDPLKIAIQLLSNPAWIKKGSGEATKQSLARSSKLGFKALSDAYKEAENKTGFTHRNWFRSPSTLESISNHIRSSWELLSEHAADYLLGKP